MEGREPGPGGEPTVSLGGDSTVALSLMRKKGPSRRTMHLEVKAFYVQNVVRLPSVSIHKIGTRHMCADGLTKTGNWGRDHRLMLGLLELSASKGGPALGDRVL